MDRMPGGCHAVVVLLGKLRDQSPLIAARTEKLGDQAAIGVEFWSEDRFVVVWFFGRLTIRRSGRK
ncbi:hypothetical protein [Mesorhizobium sp.]|uniref:hypothetical protein n=1 Tax=Mesorhizobium sp. TaxID=1871066 RepID=UPI000FE85381|nr:hypothetical protein [Mesorhizobium sp.]RWM24644.1 MAG: hypothetical protein EOR74_23405 [Mesorhizobium sp.]RWM40293.1 MAG: hypothetical protein EOR75_10580 [Mesorhizobium sp.]TIO77182.1 MAG: hypothetical protein E5X75_12075 [Mesorhizobium sp.]TIO84056.1 MAG: hypothetical protein E5X74_17440 [Mesorhizobium sp.]TJV53473.1 MAG: hypothetical protein E5Y01_03970 [Mesorhizobium sp.]